MQEMAGKELAAQVAEAVTASISKDITIIKEELEDITDQLAILTSKITNIEKKLDENELATAFLAKDVLLLKNAK